jgi:N-acetylglucosamine-6-sulfatase
MNCPPTICERARHAALATLLLAMLFPAARDALAEDAAPRPNLVVVLVDDMRWDDYGAGGHPFVETPNIDRLAREGARFTNAFATTPLCSPSRASLLTGQYAHTHGILDNTLRPSHALPVFPLALQRAGYRTGFFGKWHMGNDDSPRPGFDRWVGMAGQGEAIDPSFNVDGSRAAQRGYVTDLLTDEVLRFIGETRTQPFLVYLAHKAVHPNVVQLDDGSTGVMQDQPEGFIPAPRHRGRYADRTMPRRANAFVPPADKPALARRIGELPPLGRATATTDAEIAGRLEMLLAVDESLGRILDALEQRGELDRTAVIFTSDHGYFYGEHGLNEERRLAYEESIRVPLLLRYPPRVRAGSTPVQFALGIDLAPTALELAGLPRDAAMDGRSLLPLLEGGEVPWREAFLVEYTSDTVFPRIVNMGYRAVRTGRYKLIRYDELAWMDELYDLQSDPFELHNRIGDERLGNVVHDLDAQLQALRASTVLRP